MMDDHISAKSPLGLHPLRFRAGLSQAFWVPDMKKSKKLTLGFRTLQSLELQITTILSSMHGGEIAIRKIIPQRTDTGNHVCVKFNAPDDPDQTRSRIFAIQRIGNCCDVWLEGPGSHYGQNPTNDAA